jgi:anti-sigma factor RsiW
MRCRKIQELLKTDYLDAEVSRKEEQDIKEHLLRCPQCRRLEEELQSQRALFQKAKQQKVPERVWHNIRDAIITQDLNQENRLSEGMFERLRNYLFAPKPVFVLATTFAVAIFFAFLAGVFIQKKQTLSKENIPETDIAVYSLNSASDVSLYDQGTDIEEYFL